MRLRNLFSAAVAILALVATTNATTVWDESVNGDLSGSQAAPTPILLSVGTNSVIGNLRITSAGDSQDWLAVTVPAGAQLTSFVHAAYTSTDAQGFTGFQTGSAFVGSPGVASSYNGYAHFGTGATNGSLPATNTVGTDLFPIMADNSPGGTSAGASGFTIPLGPGAYTFLIQQTGSATTSYQFNYNVVPEPASLGVLLLGGAALMARRRTCRMR